MNSYKVTFALNPQPPTKIKEFIDVVVPAENVGDAIKVAVEAMHSYNTVRFELSVAGVEKVNEVH